jgi:hypothetical protein
MEKILLVIMTVSAMAAAGGVDTEVFSSLDRETEGLMDAWVLLQNGSCGMLTAGTAMIRAEASLADAFARDTGNLPEEVAVRWTDYLKASADCLFSFGIALENVSGDESEEILVASFARWNSTGEEFLNSVESTR